MKHAMLTRAVALAVGAIFATGAHATPPSKAAALAVVSASEDASRRGDVRQLASFMSPDCQIVGIWQKPEGGRREQSLSVQEYVDQETELLKHVADKVYDSTPPAITIEGEKAIARLRVTEKETKDGRRFEFVTDQVDTLELRNGKVLITRAEGTLLSITVDGKRAL